MATTQLQDPPVHVDGDDAAEPIGGCTVQVDAVTRRVRGRGRRE